MFNDFFKVVFKIIEEGETRLFDEIEQNLGKVKQNLGKVKQNLEQKRRMSLNKFCV